MAINRVPYPTTPNPVTGDWAFINAVLEKAFQNINIPLQFDGIGIPQGAAFQVAGIIYYADTGVVPSGSPSNYIKLTPTGGGATLVPSFVSNLSGVNWVSTYNGYYDVSNNLYIFDEVRAILAGEIASSETKLGSIVELLYTTGISMKGASNVDRNIEFASDADLLWDESGNIFILNKGLTISGNLGVVENISYKARTLTSTNFFDSTSEQAIYDKLIPFVPNNGDIIQCNGVIKKSADILTFNRVERVTTSVRFTGLDQSGVNDSLSAIDTFNQVDAFSASW